jgi:hypothetical protein
MQKSTAGKLHDVSSKKDIEGYALLRISLGMGLQASF